LTSIDDVTAKVKEVVANLLPALFDEGSAPAGDALTTFRKRMARTVQKIADSLLEIHASIGQ
ncbi:MAG: hypothetical protein HC802_20170, partial [Caldilineaceae bacterium]|nr:hypothetical protein [Caldilineaceae bacterium]